jgi:hypothetical protein
MTANTARAGIAVLAATTFAVACGGGGNGANRLTLTDDSCAYEGDETPSAAETFEAEVVNESSKLGAFEIVKIDPGHTFAEVRSYVESERQRIADGLAYLPPPSGMGLVNRAEIRSGDTRMLATMVTTGMWVLWCLQEQVPQLRLDSEHWKRTAPPTKLFLIEPALEVSD